MNTLRFTLENEKVKYLTEKDPNLSSLIHKIGPLELKLEIDYYRSLVQRIIGQQLSIKAAQTIFTRVEGVWKDLNPTKLYEVDDQTLRDAGLSRAKINYLRDLTDKHLSGEVDFPTIQLMEEEQVIEALTKVKGVGKWSAEMFLIFSLGRLNILSTQDVSIKNAIKWLNGLSNEEDVDFSYYCDKWNPYNSVASLYLWEAVNRGLLKTPFHEL